MIRKTRSMVLAAMRSSRVYAGREKNVFVLGVLPAPNEERPSARRKTWSMCASAAVVVGEDEVDSEVRLVEKEGMGGGM